MRRCLLIHHLDRCQDDLHQRVRLREPEVVHLQQQNVDDAQDPSARDPSPDKKVRPPVPANPQQLVHVQHQLLLNVRCGMFQFRQCSHRHCCDQCDQRPKRHFQDRVVQDDAPNSRRRRCALVALEKFHQVQMT